MKRLLLFLLCLLLMVSVAACSSEEEPAPQAPAEVEEPAQQPDEEEVLVEETNRGLGLTTADIVDIYNDVATSPIEGEIMVFELEDGTVVETLSFSLAGLTARLLTYRSGEADYVGTLVFRVDSGFRGPILGNVHTAVREAMNLETGTRYIHGSPTVGDYRLYILSTEKASDFDFSTLPMHLGDFLEHDFHWEEERSGELIRLARLGEYLQVQEMLEAYIAEKGDALHPNDSAFIMLERVLPMVAALDMVTMVYDSFDSRTTIFYRGLTEITRQNSFVPYSSGGGGLSVLVGFQHNNWIFADRARIRLENGDTLTANMGTDADWDVLAAGTIQESRSFTLNESAGSGNLSLSTLLASHPVAIRFEGEQDIDRELSEAEQNAITVLYPFRYAGIFSSMQRVMAPEQSR